MGTGADGDWVTAAMEDDALAVEMLMRLHDAPPSCCSSRNLTPMRMEWSVRQRRSRSQAIHPKRKNQSRRASPTTPLTWSGATSITGGSDETSRLLSAKVSTVSAAATASRSKTDAEKGRTNAKRPRRKKTLPELKAEEGSLLKEQGALKKEIARLRMHLEKQRETNKKLKKVKIEAQALVDRESISAAVESVSYNDTHSPTAPSAFGESHSTFMLPDLNIPFEEAACPEFICGVS